MLAAYIAFSDGHAPYMFIGHAKAFYSPLVGGRPSFYFKCCLLHSQFKVTPKPT